MESEWECSHCGERYNFSQFINLKTEWINPSRTEYGKRAICSNCGKSFHKNIWKKSKKIWWFPNIFTCWMYPTLKVSTVHLEMNHFGYWYETMLFPKKKWCSYLDFEVYEQRRYKTRNEASEGHNDTIRFIKNKWYTFRTNEKGYLELQLNQ